MLSFAIQVRLRLTSTTITKNNNYTKGQKIGRGCDAYQQAQNTQTQNFLSKKQKICKYFKNKQIKNTINKKKTEERIPLFFMENTLIVTYRHDFSKEFFI